MQIPCASVMEVSHFIHRFYLSCDSFISICAIFAKKNVGNASMWTQFWMWHECVIQQERWLGTYVFMCVFLFVLQWLNKHHDSIDGREA